MSYRLTQSGLKELRDRVASYARNVNNLDPAFLRAALVVLTDAKGRIDASGPGWPAAAMDYGDGHLLYRSGALYRSLDIGSSGNLFVRTGTGVQVGTNLTTPDGKYSIGVLMQGGRRAITAQPGHALRFMVNGVPMYRKSVGPAPPRPFLYINEYTANKIKGVFIAHIKGN